MPELVIPRFGSPTDWTGPLRQLERVILDPITEDTANAPLELTGRDAGHSLFLVSHTYPLGERKRSWAGSMDSIGERAVGDGLPSNRTFPYTVYVAEEQSYGASTNRATNPKAAIALGDWAAGGTGPAVLNRAVFNSRSLFVDPIPYPNGVSAETGVYFQGTTDNDRAWLPWTTAAGQLYTISAWVYIQDLGAADGFRLHIRDDTGTIRSSSDLFSSVGVWQRLTTSYLVDTAAAWRAGLTQIGDGATVAVVTALLIEATGTLNPYFDGDTPGCFWGGARHDSVATRRAAGGKRFTGALHDLEQKIEKLSSEGGTLKRVLPSGDELIFDVVDANGLGDWDKPFNQHRSQQTFTITARPYARGIETALGDHAETTLPVVIGTDTVEQASTRSGARLVVDDDAGKDRLFVVWGAQSRYYDGAPEAALFFQAEDRTPQNGATVGTRTGSSSGSVVKQTALSRTWSSVLSTKATNDHVHVGTFRFFARIFLPTVNAGRVGVELQWSVDDFQTWETNEDDAVTYKTNDAREGGFVWADLGLVTITEEPDQSGRWRGRILAKSTALGDQIEIDCYALIPCEISGELNIGPAEFETPTAYASRDEFYQAAGNIATKALPVGGTWAESGAGQNWQTPGTIGLVGRPQSANDTDETAGRYIVASGSSATRVAVQADLVSLVPSPPSGVIRGGVVGRFNTTSNWIMLCFRASPASDGVELRIYKCVGGTVTLIEQGEQISSYKSFVNNWRTLRLQVDTAGRYFAWYGLGDPYVPGDDPGGVTADQCNRIYSGMDAALATGGALATGQSGLYAAVVDGSVPEIVATNFFSFVPSQDAAIFANQSLEIRDDKARRLASGGGRWATVPEYQGDYCILPPAGREQRTLRTIVLASEGEPVAGSDPAIDDTSFQLHLTPHFDVVPEPAT